MKVRTGFVSNSSSSSFCIFGVCLGRDEATQMMLALEMDEERKEKIAKWGAYEFLDGEPGFFVSGGNPNSYADEVFVGLEWTSMDDDETKKQFMDRVQKMIDETFGPGITCSSYEEGWYDG